MFIFQLIIWAITYAASYFTRPKGPLPPRSTLDEVQIATQAEGELYGIVVGTPARSAHVHVLWYGNLMQVLDVYKDQPVCYHYFLTVIMALARAGPEAVQQLWANDVPIWPTLRDETAVAADGTAHAIFLDDAHFAMFGGWRRAGGIAAAVDIEYGLPTQPVNSFSQQSLNMIVGMVTGYSTVGQTVTSPAFAAYPDGTFKGGVFIMQNHTYAIVDHVGDTITLNGWYWIWGLDQQFVAYAPAGNFVPVSANRGILTLVWRAGYWGISPTLPTISWVAKRTQQLTDGAAQWYLAKADISGDINPAHWLRECLLDQTWGERMTADQLGTSWTTVADALYAEGFGLSFFYLPEPGRLQDHMDLVLEHIDGFLWRDRATGLLEIGLRRADYVLGDLEEFDLGDFEIIRWHTPSWHDLPGRVIVRYSNRYWPENAKTTTPYDDVSVQQKQGGRVNEKIIERPGIYSDTLAAKEGTRLGRALCRILCLGTLRSKRTMSHLHKGSVFKFSSDDPDLSIAQMVVRVENAKYGALGEDWVEVDVIQDVWADPDYTINGTPDTPAWQAPPIEPDEPPLLTGELDGHGSISGITGVGNTGALTGLGTIGGTCTVPTSFSASPSSSISQSPSSSASA